MKKTLLGIIIGIFLTANAMAADLAPAPTFQWIVSSGVVSGGCVYTYTTGTVVPKATYTDSTGGTANANPVVLDTDGRADIWLTSGEEYRFVITDSDCDASDPLDTIDGIIGIGSGTGVGSAHEDDSNAHSHACESVTITGGTIELAAYETDTNCFVVSPEAGDSDDLDTILDYDAADRIILMPASGKTITVKHGTNIKCSEIDFVMDSIYDLIKLIRYDASTWQEMTRESNG